MPTNFPELWANRFIYNLDNTDQPTWISGIDEIDADVHVINEGDVTEKNKIYVPASDFEMDVLINNNAYPIPVMNYTDSTLEFTLDKYQTKVGSVTDDAALGASYKKIDTVTKASRHSINSNRYKKAIHAIPPSSASSKTPILNATGGAEGLTDASGRKRLTYEDLVEFKKQCKNAGFGLGVIRAVLCSEHWADLALDRKNFGNQLVNYKTGDPEPVVAGFELHEYEEMPIYTSADAKKPYGAIKEAGDKVASVVFMPNGIGKKTGKTYQYFNAAKNTPQTQANQLAYRHYFMMMPFRAEKIGAILS